MSTPRRVFSKELKMQIPEEADDGVPIAELCRRYEITRSMISKWRNNVKNKPDNPFPGKGVKVKAESKRIAELERLIGRLTIENDFLKTY